MEPEGLAEGARKPEITLARWSTRFWAWLIDFIIVFVAAEILLSILYAPFAFIPAKDGMAHFEFNGFRYAIQSLMFFAYWTYFETKTGKSIGKILLNIRTTDLSGKPVGIRSAAIESFGKAFLLPLDVLVGWIFTNDKRQRLFSKAANTIVIRENDIETNEIRYNKE